MSSCLSLSHHYRMLSFLVHWVDQIRSILNSNTYEISQSLTKLTSVGTITIDSCVALILGTVSDRIQLCLFEFELEIECKVQQGLHLISLYHVDSNFTFN